MMEHYEPVTLFLSYAREDESLCKQFEKHLRPLQQQGLISLWHDRLIAPGANWAQEIDEQFKRASVILLLVSPDFLASDYCYGIEMSQALERHKAGTACVIPIILRPAGWQETPLGTLQALPSEGKPIMSWSDRDEAFEQVAKGIRRIIVALCQSVFIVSAPPDQLFVARLSSDLKTRGVYHVELRQDTAASPEESVRYELQTVSAVLLIASPDARHSRFAKEQLELVAIYRRPVIVLWVRGDSWEESIPDGWSGQEAIDVREAPYEEALQEVLTCIRPHEALAFSLVPPSHEVEIIGEPRNPYKGLRAFLLKDIHDFFGRDTLIQQMLEDFKTIIDAEQAGKQVSRLLTVIGPSGSGKSSLVMAGILPGLQQDAVAGSAQWLFLDRVLPGTAPLEALAISLARRHPKLDSIAIYQQLATDSSRILQQLVAEIAPSNGKVLLVIDQFEELFAQAVLEKDRLHFLDLLITAALEVHGPLMCILTLRADFFGRVMDYPLLYRCIDVHRCAILPLDLHELREVIEKPAALPDVQLSFEDDLVTDLLVEARGQVGALPLLQFTLDQLYRRRRGHTLTRQAYEEIGGVRGGLLKQAEDTYASLSTDEQRKMARAVFMRLVDPGEFEYDFDVMRRRAFLSEFTLDDPIQTRQMQEVIEAFVQARLLTTSQDNEKTTIEVSHEAVLHGWPRLSDWLRTARSDLSTQQAISKNAAAWEQHRKSRDRLYRGSQLKEAQEWAGRNLPSKQEAVFISASHIARIQSLVSIFVVCMLLITTTGLAGWFFLTRPPDPRYVTTLNDSGTGSLRWAIANAPKGSTITFDRNLKGNIHLNSNDLEIAKNINIQGPDTRLISISSGHQNLKVHVFPQVSTTISNLTFRDGVITPYSMIYNEGSLNLIHSVVTGNTTHNPSSTNNHDPKQGNGGGIYNTKELTLTNTVVSNNQAEQYGGGIYNIGTLTLNNNTVSGNKVGQLGSGGGIYNLGTLTLNHSTILGNMASEGGGIFNDCVDKDGFSAYFASCQSAGTIGNMVIRNSTISNNVSGFAGGILNRANFNMNGSIVSGNRITGGEGGGIYNASPFKVLITDSSISGNIGAGENNYGGGGIKNYGNGEDKSSLTLMNCTVSGNASINGGGISSETSLLKIMNSTISGNTTLSVNISGKGTVNPFRGGGGILNFLGTTLLINSTISGNSAKGSGGGIYNQGGVLFLAFSTFSENTASEGGSIKTVNDDGVGSATGHITHSHVLIRGDILVNNKAATYPSSYGEVTSDGYNLIQDMSTMHIIENRVPGTDISVKLQDLTTIFPTNVHLQNNGGPNKTYTLPLLANPSNPAIDKIPRADCHLTISLFNADITTDQRGMQRPDGKEAMCDIGAYEVQD